jgi:ATP-binding cassette, subfamily B, bacterial
MMWSNIFNPEKEKARRPADWRRLGKLFIPYAKEEAQLLIAIILNSLLGLLPPILTLFIIDKALPHRSLQELGLYVGAMVVSSLAAAGLGVWQGYMNSIVGEGIVRDIRTSLILQLHKMPLSFFTGTKAGEIMNRVANDVDSIDGVLTGTLAAVVSNFFTILTTLVAIWFLNWILALLCLFLLPLMIVPIFPVGRKMYQMRKLTRKKRDEIQGLTQETLSISGITLIKSFGQEKYERERFYKTATALMDLEVRLAMVGRGFMMILTAMATVGPAVIWLFGGWLAIERGVTLGVVVAFVTLLSRLYAPAMALAGVQVQVVSALAIFERIFDYLDMKSEVEAPDAIPLIEVNGDIAFNDVSFDYAENRLAVQGINLKIEAGQMAAFVGHSGAGKTTITALVPRFYDPQSGCLTIDGKDIRQFSLESLRSHIGIVTQETYLFHDTIGNNLKYAKPDASEDEIIAAAKAANIHDFIDSLPDKYDTTVGERGHKLSGGERQRLAIARVVLKNPKILILDEATSSLDSHNEALIQAALGKLLKGRTSLVIAHRLSTVLSADAIFVMDKGHLVESGTHEALMAKNSLYAELYREQFKDVDQNEIAQTPELSLGIPLTPVHEVQ